MANYVKATNFFAKDALLTGDPAKIIKGSEIDDEFNAIATAIGTKTDANSPTFTGVPTAPTASLGTNTTQIATTAFAVTNGFPSGGIAMWSGSEGTIPSGWALCNGASGTPDLRDRFIVGAGTGGSYSVGDTGGSNDAVVVSHTHTATVTDPGHNHTANAGLTDIDQGRFGGGRAAAAQTLTTNTSTTGITVENSDTGVSGTDANLPPYYALCFIMKL